MKVIDAKEMARIEKLAIDEGASSEAFMIKAASELVKQIEALIQKYSLAKKITFVSGKGNNGGDAFCAALLLLEKGYEVSGFHLGELKRSSELCRKYGELFYQTKAPCSSIEDPKQLQFPDEGILLDGLLGTGFSGPASEIYIQLFERINAAESLKVSIDIPSGLDGNTGEVSPLAVRADYTLYLGLPKSGFFINQGWDYIGKLIGCDFGLDQKYYEKAQTSFKLLEKSSLKKLFPKIKRSRHKYQSGFVVGLTGSKDMAGASMLSGMAALRSGAGIVKLITLEDEVPCSLYPELIHLHYTSKQLNEMITLMNQASCVYLGPGLGKSKKIQTLLSQILTKIEVPCVLDADALNLVAENKWSFPAQTLLTPHIGEMHRLLNKKPQSTQELLSLCQKFVDQSNVTLILKGGPSFIFQKAKPIMVSLFGDPGMATAGSGDVLTGLLAGLWAQNGMSVDHVAYLGVALHGLVGQYAAEKKSSYSLVASDLVKYLYKAFTQELLN